MLDDARRSGMDPQSLASLQVTLRELDARSFGGAVDGDGVWPENWPTVMAFLAVTTQWRTVSIGGGFAPGRLIVMGLDYAAVRAALDAEAIEVTPELWRGLRVMEEAAAAALNEGW